MNKSCHACGQLYDGAPGTQPGRGETCVQCGADLRCCLNCSLFDHSAYNCTSRTAEPVKDKDKRNFCDEFSMGSKSSGPPSSDGGMQKKWDDIFG